MANEELSLSRRRFIQGAGAAALAAFLAACGSPVDGSPTGQPAVTNTSTPMQAGSVRSTWPTTRPTHTATVLPTSAPPVQPTVTRADFHQQALMESPLVPTSTPAPPSPTPSPMPTPTPLATPFPAGPPSKLGLFVGWFHNQIMELVDTRNVAVLKTLELDPAFLSRVKAVSPDTLIIGRVTLGQIDLNHPDMLGEARRSVEAVLPMALDARRAGLVDAWEGFNEPVPGNEDQMRKLAELEAERVRLLADNGLRAVIGNFGTGQPPLEWWPSFRPALEAAQAHRGYLGLHEYSAPTIWYNTNRAPLDFAVAPSDQGWLTLRYRKVYRDYLIPWGLALPLAITELGVDGLVTDRPGPPGRGWQDFSGFWAEMGMGHDAAGNYIEQLAWYDGQMQLDDYVVGAAVFAMTAFEDWRSYEIKGEAASILQQYLSVHAPRQ